MQILQHCFVLNQTLQAKVVEIGNLERYIDICQWSGRWIEVVQMYYSVGKVLVGFIHVSRRRRFF